MNIGPGTILISAASLEDANFEKVVIIIAEYNKKGALGFVVNKLFPRRLNELVEFKESKAIDLYEGGPVKKEEIFFLHKRNDHINGGTALVTSIYMSGDFKQAISLLTNNTITDEGIKLFIGYCGWDDNELGDEITEGSWLVADVDPEIIFITKVEALWEELYQAAYK